MVQRNILPLAAVVAAAVGLALLTRPGGDRGTAVPTPPCARLAAELATVPSAKGALRPPAGTAIGINANLRSAHGDHRCGLEAEIARTGLHFAREDLSWAAVEPTRGRLDLSRYDRLLLDAARSGITILPLLDDTPTWAGGSLRSVPVDTAATIALAVTAARRYGPGGTLWIDHPDIPAHPVPALELMNEPYLDGQDPRSYARLALATATAVRAAAPSVRLLVVGAPGQWLGAVLRTAPGLFIAPAAAGISVHPYSVQPPDAAPGPDTTRRVETAHAQLVAAGVGETPIWITEIGWSTCPAGPEAGCVGTDARQADDLRATLRLLAGRWSSYVRALFVYALRDDLPRSDDDKEPWFGLLRPDGNPKPAWAVLAAAAR